MTNVVGRNIKIIYEKKDNSINTKYYITKNEFKSICENGNILKYIKIMKKVKNINYEQLLNNIYEILFEISIENVDMSDIKVVVNNFYKHVKVYKKHMISFKKNDEYIIKFYEELFINRNLNINILRYILHLLYNEKIFECNNIIKWYNNLDSNSIFKNNTLLKDFIEWLDDQLSSESETRETSEIIYKSFL